MDELRIILLLAGIAVVAGIYFWETRRRAGRRDSASLGRQDGSPAAGTAFSREPPAGPEPDPLERARDEHAARNARALVGLEDFDIDSDADVVVRPHQPHSGSRPAVGEGEEAGRGQGVISIPSTRRGALSDAPAGAGAGTDPDAGPDVDARADRGGFFESSEAAEALDDEPGYADRPAAGAGPDPASGAGEQGSQGAPQVAQGPQGMVTVRARRREPEQLDLDGLVIAAGPAGTPATGVLEDDPDQRRDAGAAGAKAVASGEPDDGHVESGDTAAPGPEFVVALTVMATRPAVIAGSDLKAAFDAENLRYGENQLYHRYEPGQALRKGPLFSCINVVKPGVFNPDAFEELTTPGVVLVMDAGFVKEPSAVFEEMLKTVRNLADRLDAKVCDQSRSPLTNQAINHLRESVAEYARKRMLQR